MIRILKIAGITLFSAFLSIIIAIFTSIVFWSTGSFDDSQGLNQSTTSTGNFLLNVVIAISFITLATIFYYNTKNIVSTKKKAFALAVSIYVLIMILGYLLLT